MMNPNTHNRLVAGSNPAEPTSELGNFKKSHVLPETSDLFVVSTFSCRKPTTLARYTTVLKVFLK